MCVGTLTQCDHLTLKVRPHRQHAATPSNRRRADAADHPRSRRVAVICVLETDLPGGQYEMAEEFTEDLIEKVRDYVFLYDTGHPEYKNLVTKS